MQRTTSSVDVAAVRRNAHGHDIGTERTKKLGAKPVSCAIGTIEDNSKARELCARENATAEEHQVFRIEGLISYKLRERPWYGFASVFENVGFQLFFDCIGKFHARMREQLHTVVLKRVVRGGDNHAGLKIILANETSHAGSANHASKSHGRTSRRETGSEQSSDVRAGLASVQADKDMSGAMLPFQISAERPSSGVESGVVERWRARHAANPIRSEKFFGHRESLSISRHFQIRPGPISVRATSAKFSIWKNNGCTAGLPECLSHKR